MCGQRIHSESAFLKWEKNNENEEMKLYTSENALHSVVSE